MSKEKLLLSLQEAASRLGISPRTLWELQKRGQIKAIRAGVGRGRLLFPVTELQAWIGRRLQPAATPTGTDGPSGAQSGG